MSISYDEIADRAVSLALTERRIRALWLEADSPGEIRRPYRQLEIHVAADEPDFPTLVADVESVFAQRFHVEVRRVTDTERFAKEIHLEVGTKRAAGEKQAVTVIVEKTSLIAKRPRAFVVSLVDKTQHLTHVMDFSRRTKS